MKKVVATSQVSHLWANKSQSEARNPGGNLFFHGPTIWSYGRHFAIASHLDNGRIIWNDATYSNTTAKQKWDVVRAMTQSQCNTRIDVPSLDENLLENLRRHKTGIHKTGMPEIVEACINKVISLVQSIGNMRSADKMNGVLRGATCYQQSGLTLLEYVGSKAKWPLPALPDAVPTDKAERIAFIASYAKAKLMAEYAEKLADHKSNMRRIAELMAEPQGYQDQNLLGSLNTAGTLLDSANRAYKTANADKPFRAYAALSKAYKALQAPVKARVDAYNVAAARHDLDRAMREAFLDIHKIKAQGRYKTISTGKTFRRPFSLWRIDKALETLGDDHGYVNEVARFKRIEVYQDAQHSMGAMQGKIDAANTYLPKFKGDAVRMLLGAKAIIENIQESESFLRINADLLAFHKADIQGKIESIRAEMVAEYAQRIVDWKAGTGHSIPYEAGTFARIVGNEVQTSRGARVPLEHACRLARIARRVISHGGMVWADGTGPMVGGFRVVSIGADGATVIGCHEFDAIEAMRMLDLLDSCPTCQGVTE